MSLEWIEFDRARSGALSFLLETLAFYRSLVSCSEQELGLGSKLLYVGELDEQGRALMVAGNIAGAASLGVSADPAAQRQAVRDGVADFLVNSLDEALRILKNEIRKRNAVAVCVAAGPNAVEHEMIARGVQADLDRGSCLMAGEAKQFERQVVIWSAGSSPARWLPKLDAIAMSCLAPEAASDHRWLRLAPRYLGRAAQGLRAFFGDREFSDRFLEQVRQRVSSGEIEAEVRIQVSGDPPREYRIVPGAEQST